MSTNPLRLSGILGQENDFRASKTRQKAADENAHINSKRAATPVSSLPDKRSRIPLGGKDQNTAVPLLQRSKSLLQTGQTPLNQSRLRQPGPALARQPVLRKSNSSLGFTLTNSSLAAYNPPAAQKAKPRSSGKSLPAEDASRQKELVPRFTTDSLRKLNHTPHAPLGLSLKDTLSDKTALLHARNLPLEWHQDVDPVKKGPGQLEEVLRQEALLDRLAEEGIEQVSQQDVPVEPYVPFDETPLRKEDLEFLDTGARPESRVAIPAPEWSDSEDEIDANRRLQGELELSGPVGLSAQELDQMLDW